MDSLALTNSSINFALYCAMSRQFRSEFQKLLGIKILKNWIPMVENYAGTSYIVTQVILNFFMKCFVMRVLIEKYYVINIMFACAVITLLLFSSPLIINSAEANCYRLH